ncbi:hypothetical protein ACOME3_007292 [Neoechinorhynchus agilis]
MKCVKWSPMDRSNFATASSDRSIRLFDLRIKEKFVYSCQNGQDDPVCLSWHPKGTIIGSITRNNTLNVHDVRYGIRPLFEHEFRSDVYDCAWDGRNQLYITTGHGTVDVYDWRKLTSCLSESEDEEDDQRSPVSNLEMKNALAHEIPVSVGTCICIDFQPHDYRRFAVGCANASVYVFDTEDLVCVSNISSLEWSVKCLSFSSDQKLIASASEDHLFDISTVVGGEHVAHVKCVDSQVTCAKFKPGPQDSVNAYTIAFVCDDNREGGCVRLLRNSARSSSSNEVARKASSGGNTSGQRRNSQTPRGDRGSRTSVRRKSPSRSSLQNNPKI